MVNKKLKRLPVGIQTYSEIVDLNCLYVDKTEYILKMLELFLPLMFGCTHVKPQHGVFCPLLLYAIDVEPFEQLAPTFEV